MAGSSHPKNTWTLLTATALVAVLVLYMISFTVEAGSVGVKRTFGQVTAVRSTPGFGFKAPWPIQSVTNIDTRTRVLLVAGSEELTVDQFNLIAEVAVGWRVRTEGAGQYLTRLENSESRAESLIRSRVANARKNAINTIRLADIISTDAQQQERFNQFENGLRDEVRTSFSSDGGKDDYGIEVMFVKVRRLAFPEKVSQSILDLMVRERKRISEDYRSQGENEAKMIEDNAERQRQEILADAEARAIILRGEGDAEAVKYFPVFKENEELANYLAELEAFSSTLKKNSTVVLPTDSVPFRVLNETEPAE